VRERLREVERERMGREREREGDMTEQIERIFKANIQGTNGL